jgi:uncharacterized protein (TIGR03083 family)
MTATATTQTQRQAIDTTTIPPLTKEEAGQLARVELGRVIDLLEQLAGEDWEQATDCTEWNVKQMAAHLSGACAGHASWGEFRRQYVTNPHMKLREDKIHGVNRRQVIDRAGQAPAEHIAELKAVGERAIRTRQRIPGIIRAIRAPLQPLGVVPVRYLLDTIYTRDQWMHRMDICRATGHDMHMTHAHDGRLMDLVAADMATKLNGKLPGTIELHLTGPIDLSYRFESQPEPYARVTIDIMEINRRASGRSTSAEAQAASEVMGDVELGHWFLAHCEVGY